MKNSIISITTKKKKKCVRKGKAQQYQYHQNNQIKMQYVCCPCNRRGNLDREITM